MCNSTVSVGQQGKLHVSLRECGQELGPGFVLAIRHRQQGDSRISILEIIEAGVIADAVSTDARPEDNDRALPVHQVVAQGAGSMADGLQREIDDLLWLVEIGGHREFGRGNFCKTMTLERLGLFPGEN